MWCGCHYSRLQGNLLIQLCQNNLAAQVHCFHLVHAYWSSLGVSPGIGRFLIPLTAKAQNPVSATASRGQQKSGSLLSWRIADDRSSEPRAHALAFVNPRNLCYANAVLRTLHQARSLEGAITGLGELNGSLTQAIQYRQWSFMWSGWQQPTRQRDAAEFLQHLCQKTECTALQGGWEARRYREGACEIVAEPFTWPHVRLPTHRPFQIQEAIQQWHSQEAAHAFTQPPRLLILQVSRFLHADRGIRKTRQTFQLLRRINIPTFTDHAGSTEQTTYILQRGSSCRPGSYRRPLLSVLFPGDAQDIWQKHMIHDDGQTAQIGNDATRQATQTNCYLLAYTRA